MRTLRTMYILTLACAALPLSGCMGGSTSSGNGSISLEQQVQQELNSIFSTSASTP